MKPICSTLGRSSCRQISHLRDLRIERREKRLWPFNDPVLGGTFGGVRSSGTPGTSQFLKGKTLFPSTVEGTITMRSSAEPDESVEHALAALTIRLRKQKPDRLVRTTNKVSFNGGVLRFVPSWNLLAPITAGEISVTSDGQVLTIRYKVTFTQLIIIGTALTLWIGSSFWQATSFPLLGKIVGLLSMWLWLVGGNYLLTAVRFPAFLRSTVANPPSGAEAARYPEPEYPDFPEYGPKSDQTPTIKD